MTHDEANAVFDVLVKHAGANDDDREAFIRYETDPRYTSREYRFCGSLGYGGKFFTASDRWWVSCYREDRTPAKDAIVEKVNGILAAMRAARPPDEGPAPSTPAVPEVKND